MVKHIDTSYIYITYSDHKGPFIHYDTGCIEAIIQIYIDIIHGESCPNLHSYIVFCSKMKKKIPNVSHAVAVVGSVKRSMRIEDSSLASICETFIYRAARLFSLSMNLLIDLSIHQQIISALQLYTVSI